jgi:hypothetical protein
VLSAPATMPRSHPWVEAEPTTLLYGQHFTISEISHLVDNFTDPLPESVLEIFYLAHASMGVDASALRTNQTYQGGGRDLRQLMQACKEAYERIHL